MTLIWVCNVLCSMGLQQLPEVLLWHLHLTHAEIGCDMCNSRQLDLGYRVSYVAADTAESLVDQS